MVNSMIRIMIPALLFSILVGQSNPIDIGTVGSRQLRMGGQLNISHNPATLGYLATTTEADTLNAIEESVDSLVSDFSDEIEQEIFEENIAETDTVDSEFAEFDDFEGKRLARVGLGTLAEPHLDLRQGTESTKTAEVNDESTFIESRHTAIDGKAVFVSFAYDLLVGGSEGSGETDLAFEG